MRSHAALLALLPPPRAAAELAQAVHALWPATASSSGAPAAAAPGNQATLQVDEARATQAVSLLGAAAQALLEAQLQRERRGPSGGGGGGEDAAVGDGGGPRLEAEGPPASAEARRVRLEVAAALRLGGRCCVWRGTGLLDGGGGEGGAEAEVEELVQHVLALVARPEEPDQASDTLQQVNLSVCSTFLLSNLFPLSFSQSVPMTGAAQPRQEGRDARPLALHGCKPRWWARAVSCVSCACVLAGVPAAPATHRRAAEPSHMGHAAAGALLPGAGAEPGAPGCCPCLLEHGHAIGPWASSRRPLCCGWQGRGGRPLAAAARPHGTPGLSPQLLHACAFSPLTRGMLLLIAPACAPQVWSVRAAVATALPLCVALCVASSSSSSSSSAAPHVHAPPPAAAEPALQPPEQEGEGGGAGENTSVEALVELLCGALATDVSQWVRSAAIKAAGPTLLSLNG